MIESGLLDNRHVELIKGKIVEISPEARENLSDKRINH